MGEYRVYLEYRYGSSKWGDPPYAEIRDHPDGSRRYKRFAAWKAAEEILNLEWKIRQIRASFGDDLAPEDAGRPEQTLYDRHGIGGPTCTGLD